MFRVPIYMDHHATTPLDPRVFDAMLPYFTDKFGNAASINHVFGWEAKDAVEHARAQVAQLLNAAPRQVVFTSGATEADNLAIKGILHAARPGSHLITAATEHRAVLDPARKLQLEGYQVTVLPVDQYGAVDPQQVADAIRPHTALVSLMLANNEVGTINPISQIGQICRRREVVFHCDAVQAVGKIPVDVETLQVDLLSVSAHKFYGPKGIGALVVNGSPPRVRVEPLFDGGGHENRLRSGTLPVPLIVGFGACCQIAAQTLGDESERLRELRNRLWQMLNERIDGIRLNGHPTERLPGSLNVSVEGIDSETLIAEIKDVAISSGSACTSADPEPSHVLRAMGLNDARSRTSLRIGLGRFNTVDEVDHAVAVIVDAVQKLRRVRTLGR